MKRPERLNAILERLVQEGSVAVSALSQGLGVSESSVRRDLNLLEAHKWISRTHGGAIARGAPVELPFSQRVERTGRTTRIAELAAERVSSGASVGLTSGATAAALGRVLTDLTDGTIVTNAVDIAYQLQVHQQLRVMLTGGLADPISASMTGPFAEAMLNQVQLDVTFIDTSGIEAHAGVTVDSETEAHTLRAFLRHSRKVIALAESTAVGHTRFARVCGVDTLDELITDADAEDIHLLQLSEADLHISIARPNGP